MLIAAPAAEQGEKQALSDTLAPGLRARSGLPSFAQLLDGPDRGDRRPIIGVWRADAHFHVYVPARIEPHTLAWRSQHGHRASFAEPAPLADLRTGAAWRATLIPQAGMADKPAPVSGLVVFDGDGMLARYEFVWVRGPSGWRTEDPPDPPRLGERSEMHVGPMALDPVAPVVRSMWAESCGRCLRYPLGRRPGAPNISLCRRDCLSTFSAF